MANFEIMVSIVSFDFLPVTEIIDFGFSPTEPWSTQFETIGFESTNFLENMGSITLQFYFCFLLTALIGLVRLVRKVCKCCKEISKKRCKKHCKKRCKKSNKCCKKCASL